MAKSVITEMFEPGDLVRLKGMPACPAYLFVCYSAEHGLNDLMYVTRHNEVTGTLDDKRSHPNLWELVK